MAIPILSSIPQPPSTSDIEHFNTRADIFLATLPRLQQELNGVINAFNPVLPESKSLQAIANELPAVQLVSQNIASVQTTGTGIRSVNTVAATVQSGALQKVADANAAIRALSPVALELAELAAHINDLSAISDKLAQIQIAVQQLEIITSATANITELVALGSNMGSILGVFANIDAVKAAPSAATRAQADARAAAQSRAEAEMARDVAKGFADAASGIAGLPVGTEHGAPLVWNTAIRRWNQGLRTALAHEATPGLVTGDGKTIVATRGELSVPSATTDAPGLLQPDNVTLTVADGVVSIKPQVAVAPQAGAVPLRNAGGDLEGNVTGNATPRSHAGNHAQGGPDTITPAALGMDLSIPGTPHSIVKRNAQGKIEGDLAVPQIPSTHAASHAQDGTDPVSLEAVGVVISGATPSGTAARLWVQYI